MELNSIAAPPNAEVEVTVKYRAPLNITPYVAEQKATVALILHCGQSYDLDEPKLQIANSGLFWRAPIWACHHLDGRVAPVGEINVDAETGEVLTGREELKRIASSAEAMLKARSGMIEIAHLAQTNPDGRNRCLPA